MPVTIIAFMNASQDLFVVSREYDHRRGSGKADAFVPIAAAPMRRRDAIRPRR
jgi:hypothetical protein